MGFASPATAGGVIFQFVHVLIGVPSPETHTVTVELSTDVFEQLEDSDGTNASGTLASLAEKYARQQTSIMTYINRESEECPSMSRPPDIQPPAAELVGFEVSAVGEGEAVVTFTAGAEHANPLGSLHGGILSDVGDMAMGYAYASTLNPDESFTTLELKINYLRPVWDASLTATGRVVSGGKTVGLVECDIHDSDDRLIARLSSTCLTLRDEQAGGR